jgi:MFS family permease
VRLGDTALRALRLPSFAAYWGAQTASVVADYAFWVALSVRLAVIEHSPGLLAAVLGANVAGRIALLLVGGVVTDRFGARQIVILGDASRGLAVGGLALAYALGGDSALIYVAVGLLLGCGDALFLPAYGVVVPDLVPGDQLTSANAVRLGGEVSAAAIGPAVSGAVTTAGWFGWLLAAEAASFAVAALVAVAVAPSTSTATKQTPDPSGRRSILEDALEGLRHATSTRFVLRGVMFLTAVTFAIDGPQDVLLPIHAANAHGLNLGIAGYGWLTSAGGIGALLGAAWWGRKDTPVGRKARTLGVCYVVWGLGFAVCGSDVAVAALVGIAVAGFGVSGEDVVWYSSLQQATPRELLGRTLAFADLASLSTKPASYAVAALCVGVFSPGHVVIVGGIATAVVGAMILAGALRSLDEP